VRTSAGAAVGVVTEGVDVHAALGIGIVAGDVPGDGGLGALGGLVEGDGALDVGVTTENSDCEAILLAMLVSLFRPSIVKQASRADDVEDVPMQLPRVLSQPAGYTRRHRRHHERDT